ncbi:MAG: hypothetical protein V3V70_00205 [Candidatus Scalindua sp.]
MIDELAKVILSSRIGKKEECSFFKKIFGKRAENNEISLLLEGLLSKKATA